MLAQINALPCPQIQTAIRDGDCHATPQKRRLDVRWHVVGPLLGVNVVQIFRCNMVQCHLQINPHIWIRIFIDGQTRGGVQQETVHQTAREFSDFGKGFDDIVGDEMATSPKWRKLDLLLEKLHKDAWVQRLRALSGT